MTRSLLVRGMLVGLIAGLLAFAFAWLFGEPLIDRAIAIEAARARAAGEPVDPAVVSRSVQSTLGLGVATCLYAVTLGGVFALAFAAAYGRIGRFDPRTTAALVALVGFVVLELVPFLKYPPNPPGVGRPETIGHRTGVYFFLLAFSVILAAAAAELGRVLRNRWGRWNSTLLGVAAFVVGVAMTYLVLPPTEQPPAGFPAGLLWNFRLVSLGTQALLWATLGLLFGVLAERLLARRAHRAGAVTRSR